MPILNFSKAEGPLVRASIDSKFKKQSKLTPQLATIKRFSKTVYNENDEVHLYIGWGTSTPHKIGKAYIKHVDKIQVFKDAVFLNGVLQNEEYVNVIAVKTGCSSASIFFKRYGKVNAQIKQWIHWSSTYNRIYFLHNQIKKAGFKLDLEKTHKTICVPKHLTEKAKVHYAVKELQQKHNYGVQYINPLNSLK